MSSTMSKIESNNQSFVSNTKEPGQDQLFSPQKVENSLMTPVSVI